MEWIFEFFKKLKQVLGPDEVIQRIDTRNGVSLRLKRARGSGELYVVMRSATVGNYNYHHFTKREFIQFSNAVETILNSLLALAADRLSRRPSGIRWPRSRPRRIQCL